MLGKSISDLKKVFRAQLKVGNEELSENRNEQGFAVQRATRRSARIEARLGASVYERLCCATRIEK
jgi:hypothetical protein